MESPNVVKVVAAFVAGVVIALGSALIYVRVSEMVHPQPTVLAQAPTEVRSAAVATPPETVQEPSSAPVSAPILAPTPIPAAVKQPGKWLPPRQVARVPSRKAQPRMQATVRPKIAMAQLAQTKVPVTRPVTYTPQVEVAAIDPAPLADAVSSATPGATPDIAVPTLRPQPHMVTLQAGTALAIRLSETLSSDDNYVGDTFRGTLEAPIISDGFIIADRGSKVLGRVVTLERPGHMQGSSDLNLTLTEINTTDGQRIHVETTSFEQRGPSSAGQDAATIAGGAALGAIIGAAAGGGKGAAIGAGIGSAAGTGAVFASRSKPASLAIETKLVFRLVTPLTITEKLN